MKTLLTLIACIALSGCAQDMTPAQRAATQDTLASIAQVVVNAVGYHYGGEQGAELASNGLNGLAAVAQGYVGSTIPESIIKAAPGVKGVGSNVAQLIEPNHVVKQSDVDAIQKAANIAKTLRPVVVKPAKPT